MKLGKIGNGILNIYNEDKSKDSPEFVEKIANDLLDLFEKNNLSPIQAVAHCESMGNYIRRKYGVVNKK